MIPVSRFFTVQEPSNALLSYTQKGIDFFEMVGQFAKERAAIDDEYSTRLRSLAKKYAKKSDEDDEILKTLSYTSAFSAILQQLDQIAAKHHDTAESIREDVVTFVSSKTFQLRSSRKNAISDLKTINERLEEQINEMVKAGKSYLRAYKEAEGANQKFYKADKNLEISRLELEKARNHATNRNTACDKAKGDYGRVLSSTNAEQKKYHEELLPIVFSRLKSIDQECIGDIEHVLQKMVTFEDLQARSITSCRSEIQEAIEKINPEVDSQLILESVEATMERPMPFEMEDLGDPKDSNDTESHDGKPRLEVATTSYHVLKSPGKKHIIRNLLGIKDKEPEGIKKPEKEAYADKDKPPHVRLQCLRTKIRDMEKQLEAAIQGREGITRLQQAYYDNPKHGNPSACTEPLISYAKKIETLKTNIGNLKEFYTLLEMSAEGTPERSFGGRDTPDTTRSGCSTNLSSSKTIEDIMLTEQWASSSTASTPSGVTSADDSAKRMIRQILSSPKRLIHSPKSTKGAQLRTPIRRKNDISSPVLRSSFSGAIRKTSTTSTTPSSHRSISSPIRIDQSGTPGKDLQTVIVMFEFLKTSPETMTIVAGEELIVQETDNGDGWTRAKKKKSQEVGFVPTSYLQFDVPSSPITPPS